MLIRRSLKLVPLFAGMLLLVFQNAALAQQQDTLKCLFISADAGGADVDIILLDYLFEKYDVEIYSDDELSDGVTLPLEQIKSYDFAFVSESIASSKIYPLKGQPIPTLYLEGFAGKPDATGWCPVGGQWGPTRETEGFEVTFVDTTNHPLAAGFPAGTVLELAVAVGGENNQPFGYTVPQVDFIPIAYLTSDTTESRYVIFGVEAGTALFADDAALGTVPDGSIVSENRAAAIYIDADAIDYITDDVFTLFDAAIGWIVGEQAQEVNLALNKSVTFSSEQLEDGNMNYAANAVDGDVTTRWSNGRDQLRPQWIEVDLGSVKSIYKTELVFFNDRAYQFTVEVRTEAEGALTQVVDRTASTTPGTVDAPVADEFGPVNARYVRLTVTGASGYTGDWTSVMEFRVFGSGATGVENMEKIPSAFQLSQNYPNPFNPSTNIKFSLDKAGKVSLTIYNVMGREITELVNQNMQAGVYSANWNASEFSSGVYFYRLQFEDQIQMRKMVLVK